MLKEALNTSIQLQRTHQNEMERQNAKIEALRQQLAEAQTQKQLAAAQASPDKSLSPNSAAAVAAQSPQVRQRERILLGEMERLREIIEAKDKSIHSLMVLLKDARALAPTEAD